MFQVEEYAYELIGQLQPLLVRIQRRGRSLADQLTRASCSIALKGRDGGAQDQNHVRRGRRWLGNDPLYPAARSR
jgi:hypothetical protein